MLFVLFYQYLYIIKYKILIMSILVRYINKLDNLNVAYLAAFIPIIIMFFWQITNNSLSTAYVRENIIAVSHLTNFPYYYKFDGPDGEPIKYSQYQVTNKVVCLFIKNYLKKIK